MQANDKSLHLGIALASATLLLVAACERSDPTQAATTTVGMEIDDTVLTAKVRSALLADPDIRSFDLKVETRKGAVQLSGFVDSQAQIDHAVATSRGVAGVASVESGISIKEGKSSLGNKVDDGIITTKVKSALLADARARSFDIAVVTRKGEVQLSGYVDSQAQMDHAIAIAHKIEGVTLIDNGLSIKK